MREDAEKPSSYAGTPEQWRFVVEHACNCFEERFQRDPNYRIEDLFNEWPDIRVTEGGQPTPRTIPRALIEELILLETDLRFSSGQTFDRHEYQRRFPDLISVVDRAVDRIKELDAEGRFVEDQVISLSATATYDTLWDELVYNLEGSSTVPRQLGPFVDLDKIGSGGFGVVYRAVNRESGQCVALKFPRYSMPEAVPTKDVVKQLYDEANRVRGLQHPGIVQTLSMETIDHYVFVVQEYVDGPDLKSVLNEPRTQWDVAKMVAAMADALGYAHNRGVIHRDLKPANILLESGSEPRITDFGLAFQDSIQVDLPNQRCGTPPYMSPQLVDGLTRNLDGRTDIWSLGVIMYELLTGERPFVGNSMAEVFNQIRTRDPKPLRQIDPTISEELEWICLKCLSRQARERYQVAGDLARDLRSWLADRESTRSKERAKRTHSPATIAETEFLPKGLRSYGPEDANSFLQLLPGPCDRDGLPLSIRFWKVRIQEPVMPENRIAVGVLYGPSGSGKSSFVKAGLLPQLDENICKVFVEATQIDTEERLIKKLRQHYPAIPQGVSLTAIFAGLVEGLWGSAEQKVLIIIDQFEQRLSKNDDYENSELARAFRHCEGERLQCLLLVRDDFWLALTRFADALEMDLLEGTNAQDIDLFDREHASKVLVKIGQAYGCLPAEKDKMSRDQLAFVHEAIEQLAIGNYVICVRLTLFAEMFKHRPWKLTELRQVGGVEGVGETFLESTYGAYAVNQRYKVQKQAAQATLQALLPETGTDIRGAMKSEEELKAASQLQNRPSQFGDLIRSLDQELRLISRTEPAETHPEDARGSEGSYFQLTHDYLVPSIRNWLVSESKKTRAGRAQLRLSELAAQTRPGEAPKFLPTHLEWLSWQILIPKRHLEPPEQKVMTYARRRFLTTCFASVAVLLFITAAAYYLIQSDRRLRRANSAIDRLLGNRFEQLPEVIEEVRASSTLTVPRLRAMYADESITGDDRRRVLLGLVPFESNRAAEVVVNITRPACPPSELETSIQIIDRYVDNLDELEKRLVRVLTDAAANPRTRFRAAVALAMLDYQQINWERRSRLVGLTLTNEPPQSQLAWIKLFQNVGQSLLPTFKEFFEETQDQNSAHALAAAIWRFHSEDDRTDYLVEKLLQSNARQFQAILAVFEEQRVMEPMRMALLARDPDELDGSQLASRAIALLRAGEATPFIEILSNRLGSRVRAYAVVMSNPRRLELSAVRKLYDNRLAQNSVLRQALLMIYAERLGNLERETLAWLDAEIEKLCLNEEDAGCFAAAELIARRRSLPYLKWRRQRRANTQASSGIMGNVLINSQHQAFSIVDVQNEEGNKYRLAVSMTELTGREWMLWPASPSNERVANDQPFTADQATQVSQYFEYCNWLSQQDGIRQAEFAYSNLPEEWNLNDMEVDPSKTGYRLIDRTEFVSICDDHQLGEGNELADYFQWNAHNSNLNLHPVGTRLPNPLGLFDLLGNAYETGLKNVNGTIKFYLAGGAVIHRRDALSAQHDAVAAGIAPRAIEQQFYRAGFRIVRTLPPNAD